MNLHDELIKRGFILLHTLTRTYGNGNITGSIVNEKWDGKFLNIVDEPTKNTKEVFCPFIHSDDDKKPNNKFNSIRLRNENDLNNYLYY